MSASVLRLGDMVDLLVPESNTDYILKLLLSSIVQHLALSTQKVEFRGKDAQVIQGLVKKANAEHKPIQLLSSTSIADKMSKESVKSGARTESMMSSEAKSDDVIVVDHGQVRVGIPRKLVTANAFTRLENKVKSQQAQLEALNTSLLPPDEKILEELRSKPDSQPVQNLLHNLNIAKRMSASEEGMEKLASILETFIKEWAEMKEAIERMNMEFGGDNKEALELIKTAAQYAKQIKPREELLSKYKTIKIDESTEISQLALGSKTIAQGSDSGMMEQRMSVVVKSQKDLSKKMVTEGSSLKQIGTMSTRSPSLLLTSTRSAADTPSQKLETRTDMVESTKTLPDPTLDAQPYDSSLWTVIPMLKPDDKMDSEMTNKLLAQHEQLRKNMEFVIAQINTLAEFADYILPEIIAGMPHATELRKRIAELQKDTKPACPEGPDDNDDVIVTSKDLTERMEGAEARLIKHQAKLRRQDMIIAEKTMDLDARLGKLTKSLADVVEVLGLRKHKHKPKEEEEMDQIFGKIGNLEEALIEIGCATQKLLDDKDYKMTLLENLSEEMKLIRTLKLDRFEMEDILASKADCDELNKKVPLDRFDEITNDLARGIDDALAKVSAQQSLVASTLHEMQTNLDTKFDKAEVEALKDDFNRHLQALQEELNRLAAMKEGRVAAGGKKKYLTDVNCLSCDRNVAMATESGVPCIPALADLTHMRSIRPFITYELEYLRKMKIKDPEIIKYIEYEELFRRYKLKSTDSYENLANVPNLKNRYCGGAHTVTGPQQKVPHTGHFDINDGANKKD